MEEITQLKLEKHFKGLMDISEATELRLVDEKLTKMSNLNLLPRLKILDLAYNQIEEIENLKHCPDLKQIDLSRNKISSVSSFAFDKNKVLLSLDLSYNVIEKFAASSAFVKLQTLNLENNQLTSIEFVGSCKDLRVLKLSSNRIKRIDPIDYLTKLEELYLKNNNITEVSERSFKNNAILTQVDFSNNALKSANFLQNIPQLTIANLSHNKITKLDFTKELSYLENLDISHNEISSLAELPKYAPSIIILDFSSNFQLESLDMELFDELVDLREVNFSDNFFSSRGLENDISKQYPHLEVINNRQMQRPGYIELVETQKMKEDPELIAGYESENSDALSQVSATDKYDLEEKKKDLESKAMNSKKYDNVLASEKEFKAYMQKYEAEMNKLRNIHQTIVSGKDYISKTEPGEGPDEEILKLKPQTREGTRREELKTSEIDRRIKRPDSTGILMTQARLSTPGGEKPETPSRVTKPETPNKGLLIRTQKNFKRSSEDIGKVKPPSTRTLTGWNDRIVKEPLLSNIGVGNRLDGEIQIGFSDELLKKMEIEKENVKRLRTQAKTIKIKDIMSSKASSKLISAIQMSKDIKQKTKPEENGKE